MTDLDKFLAEIIRDYEAYADFIEEDQKLPPEEALSEVLQVLLNVSCLREEGRYPSFRVCFISPDSKYLDAYIFSRVFLFHDPVEFSVSKLHKLAPALNPEISYLMLDLSEKPYKTVGILAAHTSLSESIVNFKPGGTRMPQIPNILVKDPGNLEFCFGEISVVSYFCSETAHFRTDTLTSTLVAEKLRSGSNIPEADRLMFLYKVIRLINSYRHGGNVFIVPNNKDLTGIIDTKYELPAHLFGENRSDYLSSDIVRKKHISVYADIVARLSCVDGGVVLNKDLALIGFGGQAIADLTNIKPPKMRFVAYDGHIEANRRFNDKGMRHRACYRFCEMIDDSVALIFSQDGSIQACTQDEDQVVVYLNVGIPSL